MRKVTLEQIQEQIRETSDHSLLAYNEVEDLVVILDDDEIIEKAISAQFAELAGAGYGMLVATNKRLLFAHLPTIQGRTLEKFSYKDIVSVSYDSGRIVTVANVLHINTAKHEYKLKYVNSEEGPAMAALINSKIG